MSVRNRSAQHFYRFYPRSELTLDQNSFVGLFSLGAPVAARGGAERREWPSWHRNIGTDPPLRCAQCPPGPAGLASLRFLFP